MALAKKLYEDPAKYYKFRSERKVNPKQTKAKPESPFKEDKDAKRS